MSSYPALWVPFSRYLLEFPTECRACIELVAQPLLRDTASVLSPPLARLFPPPHGDANRIGDGDKLVWKACPTNCENDFSRDEFMTYGFVFENYDGGVCLPPGV